MQTNVTLFKLISRLAMCLCLMTGFGAYAQPDYIFKSPKLISGTALQIGAVYRYTAVKPGVDAIMTLTDISPGVTVAELDGASGYPEAIQPTLNLPPWTTGYLEMTINFVDAGTNDLSVQPKVSLTCIDVDAIANVDGQGNTVYEYDEINLGGGYFDEETAGGELSVSQTGNWITGRNVAGVDYPGRDTAARAVMFSVINVDVSTMIIRTGVMNQTNVNASRLRSVYFKRFIYNNSVLSLNTPQPKLVKARKAVSAPAFKVYPSVITGSAKISVNSSKDGWAIFELMDYNGRKLSTQQIVVNKGINDIPLFDLGRLSRGNYLAVLKIDGQVHNQKVVKL